MPQKSLPQDELFSSLVKGRIAADEHMRHRVEIGDMWHEETVTDILCQHAYPSVRFARFNQHQEGKIGADWLWWWLDPSGACFGMLVQAKTLKRKGGNWSVEFNYRGGRQMTRFMKTAEHFEVPAAYTLYCGDVNYRTELTCGSKSHSSPCARCSRAGVSIIDAPSARRPSTAFPDTVGTWAFQFSSPLEDLADPLKGINLLSSAIGPQMSQFLTAPITKAHEIAAKVFQLAMRTITLNYAGPIAAMVDSFSPYFLQGWRNEIPHYVRDAMDGKEVDQEVSERIAGVVPLSL
ncbi:hypothetical protein ACFXAW_22190 [Streptomyces sp. NPDC059445]|uniref:hypothetical protein n=1 Tax=Streptomyces sp. NPDC059445 TaxID=3346832 RepID=UPI003678F6E3